MAMVTGQTLAAVEAGGWISESVTEQLILNTPMDLPLQNMAGTTRHGNPYFSWNITTLDAPDLANAKLDGKAFTGGDERLGERVGNWSQLSTREFSVSLRANDADTFGGDYAEQSMNRLKELRRDVEAIAASAQGSLATSGSTPGTTAGLGAWIKTNANIGATGVLGGWNASTSLVTARTPGTKRALSLATLRGVISGAYKSGGAPSKILSVPDIMEKLSEFMYSSTARIAALQKNVDASGVAVAAVNRYIFDHGIALDLVSSRTQQEVAAGSADVFVLDPTSFDFSFLSGYQTIPMGKSGLSMDAIVMADWGLKVYDESQNGLVADVDVALAVTA
jgi:hypothetical protein